MKSVYVLKWLPTIKFRGYLPAIPVAFKTKSDAQKFLDNDLAPFVNTTMFSIARFSESLTKEPTQ